MDEQNFSNGQNNYQDYTSNAPYQPPVNDAPSGPNGCQIASLVLGILGIPGSCCYGVVGLVLGGLGLILAIAGNRKSKGQGIGIAGLVCSIIAVIVSILATIYYGLIIQGMFSGTGPFAEILEQMGYDLYFIRM